MNITMRNNAGLTLLEVIMTIVLCCVLMLIIFRVQVNRKFWEKKRIEKFDSIIQKELEYRKEQHFFIKTVK